MSEQKTQYYFPHACEFDVPIVLKVPIRLDLEVISSNPDCRLKNGYKSVSEAEKVETKYEKV